MKIKDSYYVKRNGNYLWLSHLVEPEKDDEVIEVRKMLVANEGKTLSLDGEIIGTIVWLKDTNESMYEEIDELEPLPDEEPEEEDE